MKSHLLFISLGASLFGATSKAQEKFVQATTQQQLIESGRETFVRNCTGCHGMDAQGNGPAASMLNPKPRNLVSGSFKFRTTPTGTLPTTADLMRTIEQGIPGSAMPSFRLMSQSEKFALVSYIKSLRPDWQKLEGSPIAIPTAPPENFSSKAKLLASAFRGQKLFVQACQQCHGDHGLGDGPSTQGPGLLDSENRPIRPANLSALQVKSGRSARDIFKDISTGLDGTPMPSFAEVYNEAQRWDLVAFVMFRRGQTAGIYPSDLALTEALLKKDESKKAAASGAGDGWN